MNTKTVGGMIIVLAILGIAGYYLLGKPQSAPSAASVSNAATDATTTKEFTLKVQNRTLVEGSGQLTVNQGDTVMIHITVDEAEELHLHGYDKHIDLEPNQEGTLTLVADTSGHFPFELEHSKTELGALDVLPR